MIPPVCHHCGKLIRGTVAVETEPCRPEEPPGAPLHPACATVRAQARGLRDLAVREAGQALLDACKKALAHFEWLARLGALTREEQPVLDRLRAAVQLAEKEPP